MMKKLLAILLAVMLTLALTGCQTETEVKQTGEQPPQQTTVKEGKKIAVVLDQIAKDGSSLVKVTVERPMEESAPQTAVNALLAQPDNKDNSNPFAKANVKLLSLDIKKDLAIVNLSKEVLTIKGGSMQELLLVGSIVNTLTEFKEIKQVQILVEGKRVETLLGHMDLSEPLDRDESIMYKQPK